MKGITKWLILSIVIHLVLFKLLSVVYVNKAPKEVKEQKANRTVIEASLILTPVKATPIKAKTGNSLGINDKTTAVAEAKQTSDAKMAKQAHLIPILLNI